MTYSTMPNPTIDSAVAAEQGDDSLNSTLEWRQGQLLVKPPHGKQPYLPALESEQQLVECLKHSPVRLIRIDPALGEATLQFWANACEQANKPIFLRLPAAHKLPSNNNWWLRLINCIAAALLLLALTPVMLGLALLMQIYSPGQIFYRQWHVGKRGKLFRVLKFRTTSVNAQLDLEMIDAQNKLDQREDDCTTPLGRWMRKYSLDELPQLFNVLRGEMILVGRSPWNLHDVVRLSPEAQQQLNALPGITGSDPTEARFKQTGFSSIKPL